MWHFSEQNCVGVDVLLACSLNLWLFAECSTKLREYRIILQHLNVLCHEVSSRATKHSTVQDFYTHSPLLPLDTVDLLRVLNLAPAAYGVFTLKSR